MTWTDTNTISAEQMRLVLEVSRLLAVTPDLDALLTEIAKSATSLLCAERASIYLNDSRKNELWTRVALGANREIRIPNSAGIAGHVFQTNTILRVPRPYEDPRFNPGPDRATGFITRNLLTVPARDMNRKAVGVLQVVNRIGGEFTDADDAMIEMLADQVGVAIQRHYLHAQVVHDAELRREMDLAQRVQVAMIPREAPLIPGLRAVGWSRPASVTGGDTYDLWEMADGRLGIFLGDAAGHGIAPAIEVSQARTLVRSLSEINTDPTWLLERVNARLAADLEPGHFITMFVGCISGQGALQWASAGHGPLFLRTGAGRRFELLEPTAPPVGVLPQMMCDPTNSAIIEPGGVLVVMSDGIFEARSQNNELFEVERVMDILNARADEPGEEILRQLRQAVELWQGKEEPIDDQTVTIVQRTA